MKYMKYKFLDRKIKYDGSQLHSLFGYENGVIGNGIICFFGPAEVKEHLVDYEDKLKNDFISSERMMHFIIEIFDISLRETVLWQRLFITQIIDFLRNSQIRNIWRKGNDIIIDGKKFSVSIATKSPVSGLIHIGLNIRVGKKCPVNAIGFYGDISMDVGYSLETTARILMEMFVNEFSSIRNACYKVKGVK